MTTELGDAVFLLVSLHQEGIGAVVTIFLPAESLGGQATSLLITSPVGHTCPRSPHALTPRTAGPGGARPHGTSPLPDEALGLQPATGAGVKTLEMPILGF